VSTNRPPLPLLMRRTGRKGHRVPAPCPLGGCSKAGLESRSQCFCRGVVPPVAPPVPDRGADQVKRCSKCGEEKRLDAFPPQSMGRPGVRSRCRTCHHRHHAKTAAGKERVRRYRQRYRERNAERVKARQAVRYAIRDGHLTREPCEVCGDPKTHGHHDDYARPLDVRWLCQEHHFAIHPATRRVSSSE